MTTKSLRAALILALAAAPAAHGQLTTYEQNFESLDQMSGAALADDNWLVFATVFDPAGTTFQYNYGPFVAPNGTGAFSNVASGEGGPDQGDQQLVTFSDYNNGDHGIGNLIITAVFQEQTIAAGDADTYVFSFDAKKGDLVSPSTGRAFIRILDPNNGFSVTQEITLDTTNIDETWQRYDFSTFVGNDLAGQLLQFGYETSATNFDASGVFYDNVRFGPEIIDDDGDGIDDGVDNCLLVANADQRDTDGDGFGNACDADLNNDGVINVIDLGILRTVFFTADPDADFNGDGQVNVVDLGIMRSSFFGEPGPAAGSVITLIDDFEDGDVGDWSFFGNGVDAGGGGEVRGPDAPEGSVYFHTGWGGAGTVSLFYGGTFRNFDNAAQVDIPAANPHINLFVRNLPLDIPEVDSYSLEITLREDIDGNGYTDGVDDSVVFTVPYTQMDFSTDWEFVSLPLSSGTVSGGDGVITGSLDEVVLAVISVVGAPGTAVEPEFDFLHFTAGAPLAMP